MRRLALEICLSIFVVLAIVLALTGGAGWLPGAADEETVDDKASPYTTHSEMLLLFVTVYKDKPPVIEDLTILPQGRANPPVEGDYRIELQDDLGQTVYALKFSVAFLSTVHGAEEETEAALTFILPYDERATKVVVTTPAGQTAQKLP